MKNFTVENYDIIRQSGYVSLEEIDSVDKFEGKWIKSEKLVLVTIVAVGLLTLIAAFVLLTDNERTPKGVLPMHAIAVLIGVLASMITLRYHAYIQNMVYLRARIIRIDSFLTEVIDNDPTRRECFESCRSVAQLHNAAYQAMHSYLSSRSLESGSNTHRVVLLAKCFALFSMSNDEQRSLITQLKAT